MGFFLGKINNEKIFSYLFFNSMLDIILTIAAIRDSIYLYVYAYKGEFCAFRAFCPQKSLLYLQNTTQIATLQQISPNF